MTGVVQRPHGISLPWTLRGDGERRLVYAHGLNGQGAAARQQTAGLVAQGWTVATFDQRGHGGATPVTDPARYDAQEMAGDLLAVMDAAAWDRAWVGGGSMGAAVALVAALRAPDRCEGLLQVAPAVAAKPHPFFVALQAGSADALADLARLSQLRAAVEPPPGLVAADAESLRVANQTVTRWTIEGFPEVVGRLDCRVVVVAWEGDPIHPADVAREIAAHAKHASLYVRAINEVGDDVLAEAMA